MNEELKIYLDLSEEVSKLLEDNNFSINDVLRRANIDAKISTANSPFVSSDPANTKDILTVILVSAAAFRLVAPAFVELIETIKNAPKIVRTTYYKSEPVLDPTTGEVLRDNNGDPVLDKVPKLLLGPVPKVISSEEFDVLGISIKSKNEDI
jgi:hypothetical protein